MGLIARVHNKLIYMLNEEKRSDFYKKLIGNNDLVFDVGANHGNRVGIFVKLGAKVVAVEPNPKLAEKLVKKYHSKINVVQKAIGDKDGFVDLYINEADVLSTTSEEFIKIAKETGRFGELSNKFNQKVKVEMVLMQNLFDEYGYPKFIKIDTEGSEYKILKTLQNSIVNGISFEFAIPESRKDMILSIDHLNNIGYKSFNISFAESMEMISSINMNAIEIKNLINILPDMCWGDIYVFNKKEGE